MVPFDVRRTLQQNCSHLNNRSHSLPCAACPRSPLKRNTTDAFGTFGCTLLPNAFRSTSTEISHHLQMRDGGRAPAVVMIRVRKTYGRCSYYGRPQRSASYEMSSMRKCLWDAAENRWRELLGIQNKLNNTKIRIDWSAGRECDSVTQHAPTRLLCYPGPEAEQVGPLGNPAAKLQRNCEKSVRRN